MIQLSLIFKYLLQINFAMIFSFFKSKKYLNIIVNNNVVIKPPLINLIEPMLFSFNCLDYDKNDCFNIANYLSEEYITSKINNNNVSLWGFNQPKYKDTVLHLLHDSEFYLTNIHKHLKPKKHNIIKPFLTEVTTYRECTAFIDTNHKNLKLKVFGFKSDKKMHLIIINRGEKIMVDKLIYGKYETVNRLINIETYSGNTLFNSLKNEIRNNESFIYRYSKIFIPKYSLTKIDFTCY